MKNLPILLLLLFMCQIPAHGQYFNFGNDSECKYWEKLTQWQPENQGDTTCIHQWVYAESADVNQQRSDIMTAELSPCPRGGSENEGRICEKCLRHEKRQRYWGYQSITKKSAYQTLLDKIKKPDDPPYQVSPMPSPNWNLPTWRPVIDSVQLTKYYIRQ